MALASLPRRRSAALKPGACGTPLRGYGGLTGALGRGLAIGVKDASTCPAPPVVLATKSGTVRQV